MESIGFKEWALVCEALGRGEQSVILRKGGIAEGRAGFAFRHAEFFLFPTFFHEQAELVRINNARLPEQLTDEIELRFFARIDEAHVITNWEAASALEPLHVLNPAVVRERFEYETANAIHVAFVRAFRLRPRWRFADEPRYGGCRSWVKLGDAPRDLAFEPVLSNQEHAHRREQFNAVLEGKVALPSS